MRIKSFILLLVIAGSILNGDQRHIGIHLNENFRGEVQFAHRLKSACKNIDWEVEIISSENRKAFKKKKYDFVINLSPNSYRHPRCNNYLIIFHPEHHFFDKKGFLLPKHRRYDGYLLTYSPDSLAGGKKDFADGKKFPYMRWYPTVQKLEYRKIDPSYLFYLCCPWGNRQQDTKFKQLLTLLDKDPSTRLYGLPIFQSLYPQSYQGTIPYDEESLHETVAAAGVTLVLHSSEHNAYGLPSGRIFEAAAASTVIISDQNSFVRDQFGDSVLYINTEDDSASIHKQIQHHMEWIKTHKSEALEKAQKSYAIYKEKFLLEDQLLQLGSFHDQVVQQKKNDHWAW